MGFSLRAYFEDLDELLADGSLSPEDKLKKIAKHMEESRKYARECGAL